MRFVLDQYGKNDWITHLLETRSIFIMPMANAYGYYRSERTENGVDMNRDFPIDGPSSCMKTYGARALNELFRAHMFQLAITFHGGIESISYTWGTMTAKGSKRMRSPDDVSLRMIAASMSSYGGKVNGNRYPHGAMNDILYPVRGGMEDWAYASSWPTESKHDSSPCLGHGTAYPEERTAYNGDMLRAFNFLVETSKDKIPSSSLGTDENLLAPGQATGEGHIPRNLRLMLMLTDLVQPYIKLKRTKKMGKKLQASWEIGGALYVDSTYVEYETIRNGVMQKRKTKITQGPTRWGEGGGFIAKKGKPMSQNHFKGAKIDLDEETLDRAQQPFIGAFKTDIRLPKGTKISSLKVFAEVDQVWGERDPQSWPPGVEPQSHLVNARTDEAWDATNNGFKVQGQTVWESESICFDEDAKEISCF